MDVNQTEAVKVFQILGLSVSFAKLQKIHNVAGRIQETN